ncbi:hypothetical protein PUN28_019462 [Cardiocondyla obscurior]|uniref:Uncharacterized protein n=1 Tax=Cardiocondyla obscurior TaxID=286306 RepID=A0AAW2ECM5_9HYME
MREETKNSVAQKNATPDSEKARLIAHCSPHICTRVCSYMSSEGSTSHARDRKNLKSSNLNFFPPFLFFLLIKKNKGEECSLDLPKATNLLHPYVLSCQREPKNTPLVPGGKKTKKYVFKEEKISLSLSFIFLIEYSYLFCF